MTSQLNKFTDEIRTLKQERDLAIARHLHRKEQEAAERAICQATLNKVLSSIVDALIEGSVPSSGGISSSASTM